MISLDKAEKEVSSWLDFRKVSENRRLDKKDQIKALVAAVSDGLMVIEKDFSLTHQLLFEIGEGVKTLKYKPRISAQEHQANLVGISAADIDGRLVATISALTGENRAVVKKLDMEDYIIAQNIALFFM